MEQLQIDAAFAQAEDLRLEISDYEQLRSGEQRTFEASSLRGIADLLIKARVARGWTQRRLADELGIAEQQVQRYESTGYSDASLARLADIAEALGVSVTETATLNDPAAA
jgi:HTH-type transcriptional regulator / antitoxin HigA